MKRKVVKLGPATLVVSLPNKWVKKFDIQAGNEVDVEENNRDLFIRTKKGFKVDRETLDFNKIDWLLKRILASRYFKGCDEIEVKFNSLDKSRIVQKRVDEMIGMEIIEQNRDKLVIKDIQGESRDNFDNILRRVFFLLNSLSDESLKAISNKETDLEYLEDVEKNLNKFTDYCFRLLNKKGYSDHKQTSVLYCILYLLEQLGDEYKNLVGYIKENKLKLGDDLVNVYSDVNVYHKNLHKLFLKFSLEGSVSLAKERDSIVRDIDKLLKNNKSVKEVIVLKNFENIVHINIEIMTQMLNIN